MLHFIIVSPDSRLMPPIVEYSTILLKIIRKKAYNNEL